MKRPTLLAILALAAGLALAQTTKVTVPPGHAVATFAGGCFWCMEPPYDKLPGVVATISGYTGGRQANPTYQEVSAGGTGHAEAVQVVYNPKKVSYEKLLEVFWVNIDPTVKDRQFCDTGNQYRTGIFVNDDAQRKAADASKAMYQKALAAKGLGAITTEIAPSREFYFAEDYHQQYLAKNPAGYCGLGGTGVSCPIGAGVTA